jgi:protein-tyrosine phosphatase
MMRRALTALALLKRALPLPWRRPDFVWITPSLAQGARFRPSQVEALARAGIGSVLDLRKEDRDDESVLAAHGIHYRHLPLVDLQPPTQKQLEAASSWVLEEMAADRKVLVHCRAGVGRSIAVVSAVLLRMGYTLPQVYDQVRRRRPGAAFTESQMERLSRFAETVRRGSP